MTEQGAVPMIVMTRSQDHVEAINSTLRKAGHPVHCTWLPDARDLGDALTQINPEMLIAFIDELGIDLASVMKVKQQNAPEMPVLIARDSVDEAAIAEAMRLGLVHKIAPLAALDEEVEKILSLLLDGGPLSQARAKRMIAEVAGRPVTQALMAHTSRTIAEARASDEGREGLAAFLEKRKPGFRR